jgi:hypothetical protein
VHYVDPHDTCQYVFVRTALLTAHFTAPLDRLRLEPVIPDTTAVLTLEVTAEEARVQATVLEPEKYIHPGEIKLMRVFCNILGEQIVSGDVLKQLREEITRSVL